jgi:hypothetical protein
MLSAFVPAAPVRRGFDRFMPYRLFKKKQARGNRYAAPNSSVLTAQATRCKAKNQAGYDPKTCICSNTYGSLNRPI